MGYYGFGMVRKGDMRFSNQQRDKPNNVVIRMRFFFVADSLSKELPLN